MILQIRKEIWKGGVLVDPYSVKLSDPAGGYGLRRADTAAVVVSDGTAMVRASTGVYGYQVADVVAGVTYEGYLEIVWAVGETPSYIEFEQTADAAAAGNLYDLKPLVVPYVPGCGEPVVEQVLRRTAREFCQHTGLWQEDLSTAVVADQTAYSLASASDADIRTVEWLRVGEAPVPSPMESDWGYARGYAWEGVTEKLVLDTAETDTDLTLVAGVVLVPRISCTTYPQWLLDRWGAVLADGTVFALQSQPGQPWSGADHGEAVYRRWVSGLSDAVVARVGGASDVPVRVQLRMWV